MPITCDRLIIEPGETVRIQADWDEFNRILEELGDRRASRIAYANGLLSIMVPLPEHEGAKENLGDFIKVLLEELEMDRYALGSTTFINTETLKGVEPDNCFYIRNPSAVRGKYRLDLAVDPPPDLVLEIDITSRSHPEIYAALGVSELWQYSRKGLEIKHLDPTNGTYQVKPESQYFPGLPLTEVLPQYLKRAATENINVVIKEFRAWIRGRIN
ncbi:MAG: Uma2 family endonuclease [Cyanobacteria bacterium P01_D01_bin.73]